MVIGQKLKVLLRTFPPETSLIWGTRLPQAPRTRGCQVDGDQYCISGRQGITLLCIRSTP